MVLRLRWILRTDAKLYCAAFVLLTCTWKLARSRTAYGRGALVLIEPRQQCEFQNVFCNDQEAARAWGWTYVIVHGHGSFPFWDEMRCPVAAEVVPLYYELPKENIASGHDYSDWLKKGDLWNWLSRMQFSHVIITQTDVVINTAVDIMPFVRAYDYLGCRTRWHQHEYPPHLRGRSIAAVNGGFSLRSVSYTLNVTKVFPSKQTRTSQRRKADHWSANHEDVYFAWGIWSLGGEIASGQSMERKWCTQRARSASDMVAVHKPHIALLNSSMALFMQNKCNWFKA